MMKALVEKQEGKERAKYGDGLIKEFSYQMTKVYGQGYNERSLRNMCQFYLIFPIWSAVRAEFNRTIFKYRILQSNVPS
jgi:hypothetical protein